ncbi:MAG: FHA domain-containing protein, partial [Thermoanaerobaculales bacterium]|nr:FHA domain-containing protein [Thermoanaerobaculales bacterium]
MARYSLIHYPHEGGEERFALELDRTYRLGSGEDNDLVISQKDVSRHHAILRVCDGTFHITDLKSKNGTFVNGNRTSSAQFRSGDQVNLSSSRFVIVEFGSDEFSQTPEDQKRPAQGQGSTASGIFVRKVLTSAEDVIALLEITAVAVRNGAITDPLNWGIRKVGLKAALVLFRDDNGRVAVVSSAGDISPLICNSEALRKIALDPHLEERPNPFIRHFHEVGEDLLVVPLVGRHLLLLRYGGSPPSVGDSQALAASVEAVLATGFLGASSENRNTGGGGHASQMGAPSPGRSIGLSAGMEDLKTEDLISLPLADAREAFERWFLKLVLKRCEGNNSHAARQLGLSRAG